MMEPLICWAEELEWQPELKVNSLQQLLCSLYKFVSARCRREPSISQNALKINREISDLIRIFPKRLNLFSSNLQANIVSNQVDGTNCLN